jgi:hypothetical protein
MSTVPTKVSIEAGKLSRRRRAVAPMPCSTKVVTKDKDLGSLRTAYFEFKHKLYRVNPREMFLTGCELENSTNGTIALSQMHRISNRSRPLYISGLGLGAIIAAESSDLLRLPATCDVHSKAWYNPICSLATVRCATTAAIVVTVVLAITPFSPCRAA